VPLISVIMTSYNHAKYLTEAIESVLNQTFSDLELIIIDDASEDLSRDCIEKYRNQDGRIRTIFHDKNLGIGCTVNDGLEAAEGKYITFIASDDVWVLQKLQIQLDILKYDENLVVWSEGSIIDETSTSTGETFSQILLSSERVKTGYIFEELLGGNYILASSLIFKRENLKELQFNVGLKYLNDYQFIVDMARMYKFWFIPEPLVYYRVHKGSTVRNDYEGHMLDYPKVGLYFLEKYGDNLQNAEVIKIFCLSTGTLHSLICQQKKVISLKDAQISSMDTQISSMDSRISSMDAQISSMDAQISSMDAQIQALISQVQSRDETLDSINSSIIWQFMTKFQRKIIERIFPFETRRQDAYRIFLMNARILYNHGLKKFIQKLLN
jgi:hypothetical protein